MIDFQDNRRGDIQGQLIYLKLMLRGVLSVSKLSLIHI